MVDVGAVALSGLYANEKRLAVAADNIANANTEGFRAKDLQQSSNDGGGVSTRVVERSPATVQVPDTEGGIRELPNVSLESEIINSKLATYGAEANLKVIQTQDKLNKYLLDIQA